MKGTIKFISGDGIYGIVQGENGLAYHFDLRPDEFVIGGAEVTFNPAHRKFGTTPDKKPKATEVKMVAVPDVATTKKKPVDRSPSLPSDTLAERMGRDFAGSHEEAIKRSKEYDIRTPYGSVLFIRGYRSRN